MPADDHAETGYLLAQISAAKNVKFHCFNSEYGKRKYTCLLEVKQDGTEIKTMGESESMAEAISEAWAKLKQVTAKGFGNTQVLLPPVEAKAQPLGEVLNDEIPF